MQPEQEGQADLDVLEPVVNQLSASYSFTSRSIPLDDADKLEFCEGNFSDEDDQVVKIQAQLSKSLSAVKKTEEGTGTVLKRSAKTGKALYTINYAYKPQPK